MRKLGLMASLGALLLTGCFTVASRMEKSILDAFGDAEVRPQRSGVWFSRSRPCSLTMMRTAGKEVSEESPFLLASRRMPAGKHTFVVAVQWSNGWQDQTVLTFDTEVGKR